MTDFVLSLIRTVVPIVVGSVVGWLGARGIEVEPEAAAALTAGIGGLAGAMYYAAARWLESKWPMLGCLLGSAKPPAYGDAVLGRPLDGDEARLLHDIRQVEGRDTSGRRHDDA